MCIIKPKRRRWLKRYDALNTRSARLLKNIAQSSAKKSYAQRSNDGASRFRNECSPMVTPFERVRQTKLATGHVMVSIAACMMNKNKIGSSQKTCRTPIELSTSESANQFSHLLERFREGDHDVDEMIRKTEATEYCKHGLPWHSIKVNKMCTRLKLIILAFVKSDKGSKKAIDSTAVRAEASLCVHAELFHDCLQPTHKHRRQQLRTDVKKTNTTPIFAKRKVPLFLEKNKPCMAPFFRNDTTSITG
jgi:hypothetical protein